MARRSWAGSSAAKTTSRRSSCIPRAVSVYYARAALEDARYSQGEVHHALEALDRAGVYAYREPQTPEHILAWLDYEFGGTSSRAAAAGAIWIAQDATGPLGFCVYDVRGVALPAGECGRGDMVPGICGPLGVARRARSRGIGRILLQAALFSLRERGYRDALLVACSGASATFYERFANAKISAFEARDARRYRTTVLASGNGTNFAAVVDAARAGDLPLEVTTLVANKAQAYVLERATAAGVASRLIIWDRHAETRAQYDARVIECVVQSQPELVLLLGWMHVLPEAFVARFPSILNVHPAFLPLDPAEDNVTLPDGTRMPAYRGAHAIDDALAANERWAGASVHRVGIAIDRGAVLARAPLRLESQQSREILDERLHALERRVVATAIKRWAADEVLNSSSF